MVVAQKKNIKKKSTNDRSRTLPHQSTRIGHGSHVCIVFTPRWTPLASPSASWSSLSHPGRIRHAGARRRALQNAAAGVNVVPEQETAVRSRLE